MWIVRLALRRPYTFVVMAVLILVLGIVSIETMSTDIFPTIDIPVVTVIWSYQGPSPDEMEKRFTTISERAMTTTVNDIEHIESQSVVGHLDHQGLLPAGREDRGCGGAGDAVNQTILRILPPGTTPPFILQFSASNVPILQAVLSSDTLSEADLYDLGMQLRPHAAGDRAGRAGAGSLWRQGAAGDGGSRPRAAVCARGSRRPTW